MNALLENAVNTGKIAGAYLLVGSGGATDSEADEFLLKLFCETKSGCGRCSGCKKILAGSHADVTEIEHSKNSIKVSDIELVAQEAYCRSFEGGYKAIVIRNAQDMVEPAQNKLLKVLEEPAEKTVFLLTADSEKSVLSTVRSRCIIVKAGVLSEEKAAERIKASCGVSTLQARALGAVCGGDVFGAARLFERDFLPVRDNMIRLCARLFGAKNMAASAMVDMIMERESDLDCVFTALECVLGDMLAYKCTGDKTLIKNADKATEIEECAQKAPMAALCFAAKAAAETDRKRKLCPGAAKKIMIEDMLFGILEVVTR